MTTKPKIRKAPARKVTAPVETAKTLSQEEKDRQNQLVQDVEENLREQLVELETMIADGDETPDLEVVRGLLERFVNSPAPVKYVKPRRTLHDFDRPGETWGNA